MMLRFLNKLRNHDKIQGLSFFCNEFNETIVAERLSYPLCKPGVLSSIPGFSSLSDETLNQGPVSI